MRPPNSLRYVSRAIGGYTRWSSGGGGTAGETTAGATARSITRSTAPAREWRQTLAHSVLECDLRQEVRGLHHEGISFPVAYRIAVVLGRCLSHLLVHPDEPSVADALQVNADQPRCVGELDRTRTHGNRQPRRHAPFLGIGNVSLELVSID